MIINKATSKRTSRRASFCLAVVGGMSVLSGCSSMKSQNSPDVLYSKNSDEASSLQVPPDLTDVSNAEQFVLPGTGNSALTRNTLLPNFESVRFVRQGEQSWLEFQQTPEDLWPQLLGFAREQKYRIDMTEPVAGVIVTQWRPDSAVPSNNIIKNLVAADEQFTRVAFRLERDGGGARLFARSQATSEAALKANGDGDTDWPVSSHDPENTSAILSRFLVFLGVERQKADGILGDEQARAVLDDATVQSNSAGSEMLINRGYQPAFRQLLAALSGLNHSVTTSDDNSGRIEFMEAQTPLAIQVSPVHISAVRVTVMDAQGRKLPAQQEQALLISLAQQLG